MLMSDEYKQLNIQMHASGKFKGTLAQHLGPTLKTICDNNGFRSVLDYGCGEGALSESLKDSGVQVIGYDPAIPGKDAEPQAADLVACIDVMEHVEPEYLSSVLENIARLSKVAAYFIIDNGPAQKNLPDGRNAHLIVEDVVWWEHRLSNYFNLGVCDVVDGFDGLDGKYYSFPNGGTLAFGVPKA